MTDTTARAALIAYAATTRTVTADGLDPLIDAVIAEAAPSAAVSPPPATDRAALAAYENAITWQTYCLNCARVLDTGIRETWRAEQAEDTLALVGERCDMADILNKTITTSDVRAWLRGTRCGREAAAEQPDTRAWTPPPPGSPAEQLPEQLLALIRDGLPDYTSTACQTADTLACAACYPGSGIPRPQYDQIREHAERLHERCRTNQKFTGQLCVCGCHPEEQQPYPPVGLTQGGQP